MPLLLCGKPGEVRKIDFCNSKEIVRESKVKVSSKNSISFTPYSYLSSFISRITFSALLALQILPKSWEEEQKIQENG